MYKWYINCINYLITHLADFILKQQIYRHFAILRLRPRKSIGVRYFIVANVPVRANCFKFRTRLDQAGRGVGQLTGLSEFRLIRLYQIIAWVDRAHRECYKFPHSTAERSKNRIESSKRKSLTMEIILLLPGLRLGRTARGESNVSYRLLA